MKNGGEVTSIPAGDAVSGSEECVIEGSVAVKGVGDAWR